MTEAFEDHESPRLEQFKPDLNPRSPTPPPFVRQVQSPRAKYSKGPAIGYPEATAALLQAIAPNKPELVSYEIANSSNVDSPGNDVFLKLPALRSNRLGSHHHQPEELFKPESPKRDLKTKAEEALNYLSISPPKDKNQQQPLRDLLDDSIEPHNSSRKHPDKDLSETSLSKFLITDPESKDSLPALRLTDDVNTRLPPIQTQLGQLASVTPVPAPSGPPGLIGATSSYSLPPVTAVSPPLTRTDTSPWEPHRMVQLAPPKIPASPYSHLSPASSQDMSAVSSPVSHQTYWRGPPKPTVHYLYDSPSTSSRSPATNYPTPTDQTPGTCETQSFTPTSHPNAPPTPTGTFRCHHPGCTAAPFQTQYLLNSHANVHSQDRPHFCPVEGCSRGPGGKGFKRKNEMIRHGLVHNSPGYVCPFCPDQQHKYPRPDNLQRHVRVHHVDKNKDDPALRQVLAQRPEGSGRGRRRRINPQ